MRRVSPLREFLSSLVFFFVCLCVCVHAQRHREREGGREKHKRRSWKDTTQQMQRPLRDLLAQRGGRKEEREGESGREEHSVHCAAHVDMCEQGAKGARGAHHASHSLTSLVPLVPHLFCERESAREEERKRPREREEKKRRTLAKTFFLQCLFFYTRSPISFFPPRPPPRHSS